MIRLFVEEGGLDLGALAVDQFNVEECALATHIFPCLLVMLFGDARLDFPIEEERVQALDRCVTLLSLLRHQHRRHLGFCRATSACSI